MATSSKFPLAKGASPTTKKPIWFMKLFWWVILSMLFLCLAPLHAEEKKEVVSYPKFHLGGQLQLQMDGGGLGSGSREGGPPVRNGIGVFPTQSRISARRLRLYANAYFSDEVSLITETDFEPDGFEQTDHEITPLDAYLKWEYTEGHHFRFGQAKVPFGHEFLRSSRTITTVERSDVSRLLFQRDIGIGAFGKEGDFKYAIGIYQGQGQNERERNGTNDVVAKLVYQITPQFRMGASGHIGTYRPGDSPDDLAVRRAGLEAVYSNGPWTLEGELIVSDGYNLFSEAESQALGYYFYATRQMHDKLDAVVGYDRLDPDTDHRNPVRSDTRVNDRDRYTLGLNYYISREPIHRIMLNYEFRNELEGPSVSRSGVRVRYQYSW
jgi:phosphate-selective porin